MPPGLGEILAESGDLTLSRLRRATDWRRVHGGTIDRALLATGAVREEALLDALARLTGLPSVSRARLAGADPASVSTLPAEARRRLRAFPFERRGDVLFVAVVDPGNPVLETGLVASTGCDVKLHVTADPILEDALDSWERRLAPADEAPPGEPPPSEPKDDPQDPFARLGRALLADAVDDGVQAVEIGPDGHAAVVRSYAGGAVLAVRPLSRKVLEPLLAWLVARSQPPHPSDPPGILIERAGRRVRVSVTVNASGTGWLVLEPIAPPAPSPAPPATPPGTEICLHEAAEGDVFCPSCGTPL